MGLAIAAADVAAAAERPREAALDRDKGLAILDRTPAVRIVGVTPRIAEPGDVVQIQFAEKPAALPIVTVAGIPVRAKIDEDGSSTWWTFEVPRDVPVNDTARIVAIVGSVQSRPVGLFIARPTILSVTPARLRPGDSITVELSAILPRIASARVTLGETAVPVRHASGTTIVAEIPEGQWKGGPYAVRVQVGGLDLRAGPVLVIESALWFDLSRPRDLVTTIAVAAAALQLAVFFYRRHRRRREPRQAAEASAKSRTIADSLTSDRPLAPLAIVPPSVPRELVEACARGECVLYAGSGLSADAGLRTWRPFVADLLEWGVREGFVEPGLVPSLRGAVATDPDRVADSLVSRVLEKGGSEAMATHIRKTFRETEGAAILPIHARLPEIGFSSVLTTNFDRLIERAWIGAGREVAVRLPRDVEATRGDLASGRFFVLKLYGDLDRADSLILSSAQYEAAIQSDRPFADLMQQIFLTRTIVFLGCSLEGIEDYLRGLQLQPMSAARHFALSGVTEPGWEVQAEGLERRYGIKVLPYDATGGHGTNGRFVAELHEGIRALRGSDATAAAPGAAPSGPRAPECIASIELTNIGPFGQLQVEFDRGWGILLGDNGVGKSTIIKAIALAVAGESASAYAGRLLRAGTTQGEIKIRSTTGQTYITHIGLNSLRKAEVKSIGPRALAETLVMGFPPTRFIAAGPTRAPQDSAGTPAPSPQDVLPILSGQPDPRVLEIKQWLVNLDYARARARAGGGGSNPMNAPINSPASIPRDAARAGEIDALLDGYFSQMGKLLDLQIGSHRIDKNEVLVTTVDGELPMDAMSQGTVSIFGWVGAVLQRQFEIRGATGGPAIVLVDEIDAHMHPEWQQAMATRLREAFPEAQFIVSTHSPFLAIGRKKAELIRLTRSPAGPIVAEHPPHDTTDVSYGTLLTSPLFSMQSDVSLEQQKHVLTRRELSVKDVLTPEDRGRLAAATAALEKLDDVGAAHEEPAADPTRLAESARAAVARVRERLRSEERDSGPGAPR